MNTNQIISIWNGDSMIGKLIVDSIRFYQSEKLLRKENLYEVRSMINACKFCGLAAVEKLDRKWTNTDEVASR